VGNIFTPLYTFYLATHSELGAAKDGKSDNIVVINIKSKEKA
jgi:hypothetical protein